MSYYVFFQYINFILQLKKEEYLNKVSHAMNQNADTHSQLHSHSHSESDQNSPSLISQASNVIQQVYFSSLFFFCLHNQFFFWWVLSSSSNLLTFISINMIYYWFWSVDGWTSEEYGTRSSRRREEHSRDESNHQQPQQPSRHDPVEQPWLEKSLKEIIKEMLA